MPFKPALHSLLLSSLLVLNACSGGGAPAAGASVSDMIVAAKADPATTMFQDLHGHGFDLSVFAGKKVFLNYWATWCAPCIREIPAIASAAAALGPEKYVFLLASDEAPDTISAFLAERGFAGNFIKLNGYFGSHGIDAVPSSLLYDEQGALVKTWGGAFEWNTPQMLAEIRSSAAR
ncbi:MAG: TlpA family protein disulfide reductase [Pseudomonadales bacterium]|jgi:thiol-disulfide isomerase/thioredoxin|nr:TlpA family protein disulfide reductase [Pseudomonadales bacterium]